jgi:ADP-ribosylglycohydrolase
MNGLPEGYRERVYAGVLGKIIGVYLGRPFEQWSHEKIEETFGEIRGYVHEKQGVPLIVSDDDITGTFTFFRALEEQGFDPNLSPAAIGDAWLNFIIENRSILWWGGLGRSAEHTAFLNLKKGIKAPESGSIAQCGEVMAQQIGAQIFIDGWGLICPGDPEKAADYARRAGSVSHDGEAIYGAQSVAAMVAMAFEESDVDRLMDAAMEQIPSDCLLRKMVDEVREWSAQDQDWRKTLRRIQGRWGYEQWKGGCHMLPNHAVIILALAYGKGAFGESMMVVNTAGYDTDCNSGNVGCILGVAGGLAGLEDGGDWRGPVADRLYLPSADGGRVISDAARETDAIVEAAHKMRGLPWEPPKGGRRFHFSLPGSVQGFGACHGCHASVEQGDEDGETFLRITSSQPQAKVMTPTWLPSEARGGGGYHTMASPTLYPGQTITARVSAPEGQETIQVSLAVEVILDGDSPTFLSGPPERLAPGETKDISWTLDLFDHGIITEVGVLSGQGELRIISLGWVGAPKAVLGRFSNGHLWRRQFVAGVTDEWHWSEKLCFSQSEGTGLMMTGTREWTDYKVEAAGSSLLSEEFGIAVRVAGMRRYLAVVATRSGKAMIVSQWDDERSVLAEGPLDWQLGEDVSFSIKVEGGQVTAKAGKTSLKAKSGRHTSGGAAALVTRGSADFGDLRVSPAVKEEK